MSEDTEVFRLSGRTVALVARTPEDTDDNTEQIAYHLAREVQAARSRALLFSAPHYYPSGGWGDFIGEYRTTQAAMDACEPYNGYDWAWAHVVVDGVIAWERVDDGAWTPVEATQR